MTRTIEEALKHAEEQRIYAQPGKESLVSDFILLADEVRRLREIPRVKAGFPLAPPSWMDSEDV